MAKILAFNNDTDRMKTYYRGEADPMPYNTNETLRVREFRESSKSNILWTTKRTMQSWNSQRYIYGSPIPVGFAFKRPYEGGHGNQSHDWIQTVEHMKIWDRRWIVFVFLDFIIVDTIYEWLDSIICLNDMKANIGIFYYELNNLGKNKKRF